MRRPSLLLILHALNMVIFLFRDAILPCSHSSERLRDSLALREPSPEIFGGPRERRNIPGANLDLEF